MGRVLKSQNLDFSLTVVRGFLSSQIIKILCLGGIGQRLRDALATTWLTFSATWAVNPAA